MKLILFIKCNEGAIVGIDVYPVNEKLLCVRGIRICKNIAKMIVPTMANNVAIINENNMIKIIVHIHIFLHLFLTIGILYFVCI